MALRKIALITFLIVLVLLLRRFFDDEVDAGVPHQKGMVHLTVAHNPKRRSQHKDSTEFP